jgi:hypothetical protein
MVGSGPFNTGQSQAMKKKERLLFLTTVKMLLLDLGAEKQGDDFVLETKAGRLTIYPTADQRAGLGTVFSRFDDPHAAQQFVDCNRFSGRWNHHYSDGWNVETAFHDLSARLKMVLA